MNPHHTSPLRRAAFAVALALALQAAPLVAAEPTPDAVTLNFVNADLDAVVRAIGQYTGRSFVVDPRAKGTLTLVTERPVSKAQAYEQLLAALRLQGFTIVEAGGTARVVPEADAKLQGGAVVAPASVAPRGDQIVTQVFRLNYESASSLVPVLRPLIAPNNTISAYPANNTLVITDYADNLRRIARIIEAVDTPATSEVELLPVRHGLASELAAIMNRVLDESSRGAAADPGQRVAVLAEPRTNSLIVRAPSPARLALARSLLARLDQPAVTPGNINVVYLKNAEAAKLAPLLRAIIATDPSYAPAAAGSTSLAPQAGAGSGIGMSPASAAPGPAGGGAAAGAAGAGGAGGGPLAGMIQADAATNSLIITAPDPLYRNVRAIIDKLDVRRAQVVIESLIVEVAADKAAEFGVQWQALGGLDNNKASVVGGTNFGPSGSNIIGAAQNLASLGPGLNLGVIKGKVNIPGVGEVLNLGFLARALEATANANILSTPTIQTLDNEEAKFLVGQNVPLVTGSYTNTGASGSTVNPFQTFERKDIGLQLRVKPQISEGGVVRLQIYQELSSIQGTATTAEGGGGIITSKRSFESMVLVEDGSIVVLGGLIEDKTRNEVSSVPLLGDIPYLGRLFKYENRSRTKTNLIVFLRPYVVRDEARASSLALDRYDYIRGQVNASQPAESLLFRGLQGDLLPELPLAPGERARPAPAASPAAQPAP